MDCGSKECENSGDETDKRGRRSSLGRRDFNHQEPTSRSYLVEIGAKVLFPRRFTGSTLLDELTRQSVGCDEKHDRLEGKELKKRQEGWSLVEVDPL